jgi:hypothetical protein
VGAVVNCPRAAHGAPEATVIPFVDRWGLVPSPTFAARCRLWIRPAAPLAAPASRADR